jgi:hypothetical protein
LNQLGDDPQPAPVRRVEEAAEVVERAVGRVNAAVIRDIVPVVAEGRGIHGQQPQTVDAEGLQVVELRGQAVEVADTVGVAVTETLDVQLIDHRVLVPERIGMASRQGGTVAHAEATRRRWTGSPATGSRRT